MPSVTSLLESVKDLALVGAGDATDDARVMRYMNLVYGEIWRRTAATYNTLLETTESVTITDGAGTLSSAYHQIMWVKDTANNNMPLTATSLSTIEDMDWSLDDTGSPTHYYMTGTTAIKTWPSNSTTIKVRYVPTFTALASTDAESAIKIPAEFHDTILWGTLVYMAHDERDKASIGSLQLAQSKYEIALADYMQWLSVQQVGDNPVTKAVLGG